MKRIRPVRRDLVHFPPVFLAPPAGFWLVAGHVLLLLAVHLALLCFMGQRGGSGTAPRKSG